MTHFTLGYYNGLVCRVLPFVDYAIPLSKLTKGINIMVEGWEKKYKDIPPKHEDFTTTHINIDESMTPKTITQFIIRELEPFRRLIAFYEQKIWFIEEVLEELGAL